MLSDTHSSKVCIATTSRIVVSILLAVLLITALGSAPLSAGSGELNLTILHTNDEHSSLIPHSPAVDHDPDNPDDPTVGGFARLTSVIDEIKIEKGGQGEPVLLFNAGDFLGGTPFGWLAPAGYAAELSVMQAMGYDAVIIGNHEYDYGPDVLADYLMAAGYPGAHQKTAVLASNTRPPAGHPLAEGDLLRDTAVFELDNGLTVGAFGLLGEDAESVAPGAGDVEFLDRHRTAQDMVETLQGSGADIIVAITHSGVHEDVELAQHVPGIDVIVGGHCHTALYEPVIEGATIIVQAGSLGRYLGRLELGYNPDTGVLRLRNEENNRPFLFPIDGSIPPQPEIGLLIDEYTAKLNALVQQLSAAKFTDILETVVHSSFQLPNHPPLQESPVGNFITDGMRMIGQQVTGTRVDIAVQANGNIRESMIPGTMAHAAEAVSFYDIADIVGLGYGPDGSAGYPVVSVYLTGEELRRLLEVAVLLGELMGDTYFLQFSGLRYDYNPNNALLFTVPVLDQPVPTSRAVTRAELYTGDGVQPSEAGGEYVTLEPGDEQLYHLVTDRYIASFLPMVGDMLPHLSIVPKTADGEPVAVDDLDRLIVYRPDGRELKVWHTVLEYAAMQPPGEDGLPRMPEYYAQSAGRINPVWSFPLIAAVCGVPALALGGIAAGFVLVRGRRRRAE